MHCAGDARLFLLHAILSTMAAMMSVSVQMLFGAADLRLFDRFDLASAHGAATSSQTKVAMNKTFIGAPN